MHASCLHSGERRRCSRASRSMRGGLLTWVTWPVRAPTSGGGSWPCLVDLRALAHAGRSSCRHTKLDVRELRLSQARFSGQEVNRPHVLRLIDSLSPMYSPGPSIAPAKRDLDYLSSSLWSCLKKIQAAQCVLVNLYSYSKQSRFEESATVE